MRLAIRNLTFAAFCLVFFTGNAEAQKRVWTSNDGHQVIATLEDQTEHAVSLRVANRQQPVVVLIQDLSEEDQAFAKKAWLARQEWRIGKPGAHAERMQNPLFAGYVGRLDARREIALDARRVYNANKGPAVYFMGNAPNPMFPMGIAIEQGWVYQPPISFPYYRYRYPRPWPRRIFESDDFVHSFSD